MVKRPHKWPPIDWLWRRYAENAAWYSGDPVQLRTQTQGFWRSDEKHKVHVPLAGDLAALAAGLLFSDSPTITHDNAETDARLQRILMLTGMYQKLLHAAELQAVYGGVFLKWNWDTARADYPLLRVVPADAGLPTYANGLLDSVKFWSVVRVDENAANPYWRLQETYTGDGRIESRLFNGTLEMLGQERTLDAIPETAGIKPSANSGAGVLLATYVPARLPNRERPYAPYGRSDYEGLHTLFSALDEAYSSMVRDLRLGKTQVIVPAAFLRAEVRNVMFPAGGEVDKHPKLSFSKAEETYVALDIDPDTQGAVITTFQPKIRSDEHLKAIDDIVRRIITLAGYAPQSAGLDVEGRAESGTALNVRERRSLQTAETKKTYWWHALIDILRAGLLLDKAQFTRGLVTDGEISVEFADNTQPDMQTLADTLDKLERASAMSTDAKVRLLHPDWDEEKIVEEVARIREERGMLTEGEADPMLGDLEGAPPPEGSEETEGGEQ